MLKIDVKFEAYQSKYETSAISRCLNPGLTYLRKKSRDLDVKMSEISKIPELILKTTQLSLTILSFSPPLNSALTAPKCICKDIKNFFNFFKCTKSIDGILNFRFSWKSVVLSVSGITLSILSTLTLIDRYQILNVTAIKARLSAIPVLGVLPYGGLATLATLGLLSTITVIGIEKKNNLSIKAESIRSKKLGFWSEPLTEEKIEQKKQHYEVKVLALANEEKAYTTLIQEGKQVEQQIGKDSGQIYQLQACRKAIQELEGRYQDQQNLLIKYRDKSKQWSDLKAHLNSVNQEGLEKFRHAKEQKWKAKLNNVEYENRATQLSLISSETTVLKLILTLGAVISGYGMIPSLFNLGLEISGYAFGTTSFFMKRSIEKMTIEPVNLVQYLEQDKQN